MSTTAHRHRATRRTATVAVTAAVATAMALTAPTANAGIASSVADALHGVAKAAEGINNSIVGIAKPGAGLINGLPGGFITATPAGANKSFGLTGPLGLGFAFVPITLADINGDSELANAVTVSGPGGSEASVATGILIDKRGATWTSVTPMAATTLVLPGGLGALTTAGLVPVDIKDTGFAINPVVDATYRIGGTQVAAGFSPGGLDVLPGTLTDVSGPGAGLRIATGTDTVTTSDDKTYGVQVQTGTIGYDDSRGLYITGPSVHVDTGDTHSQIGLGTLSTKGGYQTDFTTDQPIGNAHGDFPTTPLLKSSTTDSPKDDSSTADSTKDATSTGGTRDN